MSSKEEWGRKGKLEHRILEIIQFEQQRKIHFRKRTGPQGPKDYNSNKNSNICVIGVLKGKEKKAGQKYLNNS